jgi:TctA family transporter
VLGAGFESNLRQGILLMDSSLFRFLGRPWTSAILTVALALLIYGTIGTIRMLRQDRARTEEAARRRSAAAADPART